MHLSLSGIHKLTQFLYLNDPFKNNSFTNGNLAFRFLELNFRAHSTKFVLWPLFYRNQTFTQLIFPVCEPKIAETNRFDPSHIAPHAPFKPNTFSTSETISENLSLLNPAKSHSAGSDLPSPKFPNVSGPEGAQRPDKTLQWILFPRKSSECKCSPYYDCLEMWYVCLLEKVLHWCVPLSAVPFPLLGIIMMCPCQAKLMPVN